MIFFILATSIISLMDFDMFVNLTMSKSFEINN